MTVFSPLPPPRNILRELYTATRQFFRAGVSLNDFLDEEKNREGVISLLQLVALFDEYKDGKFVFADNLSSETLSSADIAMRSALGEVKEKYPKFFEPHGTNDQGFLFLFKKVVHKNDLERCIDRMVLQTKNHFFDELDMHLGRFFPESIARSKQDIEGDFANIKLHLGLLMPTQELIDVMGTFLRDLHLFTVSLLKKGN